MAFLFEDLDVYKLSLEFNGKVITLCKSRRLQGYFHLIDQLRRSALSIPLNIAEGNGRYHKGAKRNFYYIARGSAFECIPILTLCEQNTLLSAEEVRDFREDITRISKMLSGLIARINNNTVEI